MQSIQCIHRIVKRKGIRCIRVIFMKKTENITFRIDPESKHILAQYAAERKWSTSLLVEVIVQEWIDEKKLRKEKEEP